MVDFKLVEETKSDVTNMSRAWDTEEIWVPDRNWIYDLTYTGRMLF